MGYALIHDQASVARQGRNLEFFMAWNLLKVLSPLSLECACSVAHLGFGIEQFH
jgi:hypothetical protein